MPRILYMCLSLLPLISGCATLQQLAALRQVQFQLNGIDSIRLAGVAIGSQSHLGDFSTLDAARLSAAFLDGKLPLSLQALVGAENPASNGTSARFLSMDWTLRLQGEDTVSGRVDRELLLEPGKPAVIPVQVELDLVRFFEQSLPELVQLVGGLSGVSSEPTLVELMVLPTIETSLGPMAFPQPVRVVRATSGP
jgi:hypothetical protein